ncbi:uncharacterized protein LOC110697634 [Chenopodium quinoa]|uniref:uncharacterized protein LOC110697634 n=1 Tax=Chenopodium quinoa TaxID=63459 RepID=UPI000B77F5A4|nr:uncharacterized protein LOC110697634 [Chenopodium quinoa]
MYFSKSSSSSSSDGYGDHYKEFDNIVDEFARNYLPAYFFLQPTTPQPLNRNVNEGVEEEVRGDRKREEGHNQLFRMNRPLFNRIMNTVVETDKFFKQRRDATGRLGLSPLQKCTATIRMLAYSLAPDAVDEYVRMGQTTARRSLHHFCEGVNNNFQDEYLRTPTDDDLRRILYQNESRGFPRMIGSIDYMHWVWKNCPMAWKAQYSGRNKNATLDRAPPINFSVNGHEYNLGYYLTDGIYPDWETFIQGFSHPQIQKHKLFADKQAAARKDVERAFGVLQARFAILRQPSLAYDEDILSDIMKACIIMHNMIVEDERHHYIRADVLRKFYEEDQPQRRSTSAGTSRSAPANNDEPFQFNTGQPENIDIDTYLGRRNALRDKGTHESLKYDLIEHIWQKFGPENQ